MDNFIKQKGFMGTALTLAFSPIVLGFLIGALPVLIPVLIFRGLSKTDDGLSSAG